MDGILIVDKPPGMTSHDVVDFIRRSFGAKKVGHCGTLDPLATGVLVILIGRATRLSQKFSSYDKTYDATITLGILTDTADSEGAISFKVDSLNVTEDHIEEVFKEFRGSIEQIPPMVSAIKYGGKRLYKLARQGIVVPRKPREVYIHKLEITSIRLPEVSFEVVCSKGTYVRSLCEEIGSRLGCGGHMSRLRRMRSGPFLIEHALTLDILKEMSHEELKKVLRSEIT